MEKELLNPYDKEFMRMAMLKHEETFRQQVYELHRIYKMQKTLMMKSREESCREDTNIKESEIELTLGPSCYKNGGRISSLVSSKRLLADDHEDNDNQNEKQQLFMVNGATSDYSSEAARSCCFSSSSNSTTGSARSSRIENRTHVRSSVSFDQNKLEFVNYDHYSHDQIRLPDNQRPPWINFQVATL